MTRLTDDSVVLMDPTLVQLATDFRDADYVTANDKATSLFAEAAARVIRSDDSLQYFEGPDAADKLTECMREVESVLASICSKHTQSYWLMLLRRLYACDVYTGEYPQTSMNIQTTAELVVLKHGREGTDDLGITVGPSLADEQIREKDSHDEALAKLGKSFVSPVVTREDLQDVVAIQRLAAEYYHLTAEYRRAGKGATLCVRGKAEWKSVPHPILDRLTTLYDTRLETAERNVLADLGVSYIVNRETILPNVSQPMAFCTLGPQRRNSQSPAEFIRMPGHPKVSIPASEMRYIPAFIDLGQVHVATSFSTADFSRAHQIPWEAFASFLTALAWHACTTVEEPYGALRFATLVRRGCMLTTNSKLENILDVGAKRALQHFYPGFMISDSDWRLYHDVFSTMATTRPDVIDLHSMRPQPFLTQQGNATLVDYASVNRFVLECLRIRISDEVKDAKALIAEGLFEERLQSLTGLTPCFPRNKKFKIGNKVLGEADLSFRVGTVYIPVDVKAYLVTVEFDRGDYKAVRTRWGYVQQWVSQAESLAASLRDYPRGSNYDLLAEGITHVLPIVCSPFHEYLASVDKPYMLDSDVPRVATPMEIATFLKGQSEASLKVHHCSVSLQTGGESSV